MTKRFYLDNSYLTEHASTVTSCTRVDGGYEIELLSTVLFPTGGGQPNDLGTINGLPVLDVTEKGEAVFHRVKEPLEIGTEVFIKVDWARRFDHMQQHTGEHVLSFAAKELFSSANVGFHLAASYSTVDLDKALTTEQAAALEVHANALLCTDLPVMITYEDISCLDESNMRKIAKGLSGVVRVIRMPGGDSCTCCGTHVNRTGEIGFLKITGAEHYKGGTRITFVCGARALKHAQKMQGIVDTLAKGYSCRTEDVENAVTKTQNELSAAKREEKNLYMRLTAYIQRELQSDAKSVSKKKLIVAVVDLPGSRLRPLALKLCEEGSVLALLAAKQGEQAHYVLCVSKSIGIDAGELMQAVNLALNGKGGGRDLLAQGSAPYTRGFEDVLGQVEEYFIRRLK